MKSHERASAHTVKASFSSHEELSLPGTMRSKKTPAQLEREIATVLKKHSHATIRTAHRGTVLLENAQRLETLPDAAICDARQGGSRNLWYAEVALEKRWPSDPDFATARKTQHDAIQDCAAKIRADLRGEGSKYAPHWSHYDVTYRLLPYWEQRAVTQSQSRSVTSHHSTVKNRGSYPFDLIPGDVVARRDIKGRKKYQVSHLGNSGEFVQVYTREVGGNGGIVTFDRSQLRLAS